MNKFYNRGKWRTFLKESVQNPVKECGEMPPEPPMPSAVPIPSDDADPMALAAELGAIGLDPAMAQGVVDLLLSKGLLGTAVDPVDPVGAPPMMESGDPHANMSYRDQARIDLSNAVEADEALAQYSPEAVEAAQAALETIPDAGAHSGAALENEIHHYLETGFGETKRPREIFKIADEALAVAGVILGLGPDAL